VYKPNRRTHMSRLVGVALLVVAVLFPPAFPGEPPRPEVPEEIAYPFTGRG
jgi:hypothetical protein